MHFYTVRVAEKGDTMGRLEGKIAIVTGASRGIGEGIARMFAREGASVTLAARTVDRLNTIVGEIEAAGGSALAVEADVASTDSIRSMVEATVARFGGLDILVNNAAVTYFSKPLDSDGLEEEYDRLMATNVKSVWMAAHFGVPHMRVRGGGSIINISSVHAVASGGRMSAYAASKGALVAGTHAMAIELGPDKIRINCLSPGRIWTWDEDGWIKRRFGPEVHAEFVERFGDWDAGSRTQVQPLPVEGKPEDVAYCAVYLASDESRFVTGANFLVDGGMTSALADPGMLFPGAYETMQRHHQIHEWFTEVRKRQQPST
jgi:3-oxoacyl-[acyl-carrier protein] reductase